MRRIELDVVSWVNSMLCDLCLLRPAAWCVHPTPQEGAKKESCLPIWWVASGALIGSISWVCPARVSMRGHPLVTLCNHGIGSALAYGNGPTNDDMSREEATVVKQFEGCIA